jgi:thiol-disulfide isomerase/thioredoxin
MESILLLSKLFLAAIFGIAGITKLMDLKGSEVAVRDFGVPEVLVKPISIILPLSEVVIAALFFSLTTSWIGALAALLFLVWFTIGMGYQMAKGNAPDCHCFGQLYNEPVRISSLVRNAIFSIPAIFLVTRGISGQGPSFVDEKTYTPQFVFGVLLLAGVAALLFYARLISGRQGEILRRLEIIEAIGAGSGAVERSDAGDPTDGLPIGAVLPDFELPDDRGRLVRFEEILGEGKPTLFFFLAPTCQPCTALIPEMEKWRIELGDRINFIVVSRGTSEENAEKFAGGAAKHFLLQRGRELQDRLYAKWTPSALLVNADGRVASHVAAGDSAIRSLIEKIRSEDVDDPFFYFAINGQHGRTPKIGQIVPDFELNDLDGRTIASRELFGRPTLVAFWSLTCPHCSEMAEQIREWEKSNGLDDPRLLLFSDGDIDEHRKVGITSPIIIDKAYGTSAKFGMYGTPSGVLIDENGRIASETAIGASNIWALIGRSIK